MHRSSDWCVDSNGYSIDRCSVILFVMSLGVILFHTQTIRCLLFMLVNITAVVGAAQETGREPQELGTKIERRPFVKIPIRHCVTQFRFSKDETETWCMAGWSGVRRGDDRGRALVYDRHSKSWMDMPLPTDPAVFHDVAFSGDGKTTWIAMSSDDDRGLRVRQRKTGSTEWHALDHMPEHYSVVEKFWLSPDARELWMYTSGCGLIRSVQGTDKIIQYVQSDVRQFDQIRHATLIADYVYDLVFTSDSRYAICAAMGGDDYGITKIDLDSDKSKDFPVSDAIHFEQLVIAPNNKHVWCIGNNSYLWCFDIESETWIHKCSSHDGMPLASIDSLICSPDSRHVWISGYEGVACYSLDQARWRAFTTETFHSGHAIPEISSVPLGLAASGHYVIASHATGLAFFDIAGDCVTSIESNEPNTPSSCTQLVAIPNSQNYLCALEFDSGHGGLYLLETKTRSLKKLFALNAPVTAMAISPSIRAWVAMPGIIYELDCTEQRIIQEHAVTDESTNSSK